MQMPNSNKKHIKWVTNRIRLMNGSRLLRYVDNRLYSRMDLG